LEIRIKPTQVAACLDRLAGSKRWRETKESTEWRLVVRTRDELDYAIRLQVGLHRKEVAKASFNQLADRLIIDRKEIHAVLRDWSHEQLVAHLQQFTQERLRAAAMARFRRG
jgi:hypothetical protein